MKNRNVFITALLLSLLVNFSCSKTDKDDVYPGIDMTGAKDFPKDCDTVFTGESFVFHAVFTDNQDLGAYSIDIHQNFDHHTHSSSLAECSLDPVKTPVNPLIFIREYSIPGGSTRYVATDSISVPAGADPGDYHMMVRLTDREGWQTLKGISIKVIKR
jgi:hypothetical protein